MRQTISTLFSIVNKFSWFPELFREKLCLFICAHLLWFTSFDGLFAQRSKDKHSLQDSPYRFHAIPKPYTYAYK